MKRLITVERGKTKKKKKKERENDADDDEGLAGTAKRRPRRLGQKPSPETNLSPLYWQGSGGRFDPAASLHSLMVVVVVVTRGEIFSPPTLPFHSTK